MSDKPCAYVICFRVDHYIHLVCPKPPPKGMTGFSGKQTSKGSGMSADIIFQGTNDVDPNIVSTTTTFTLNGAAIPGVVTQPATAGSAAVIDYMLAVPTPAALAIGDQVVATNITMDNSTPPQFSPPVVSNTVIIQAVKPPPTGMTGFVGAQVGAP